MDWIPAFLTNVSVSDKHVKGIVRTERELESIIEIHRKQFNCSFVFWADDKSKKEKTLRRVLWNHKHVGMCRSQESEGQIHPFCIANLVVRACQYGKPHSRKADQKEPDHSYPKRKKLHVQDSRKCDCSAKLFIRKIRRFDNWLLEEGAGRSKKQRVASEVDVETDKNVVEFFCVSLPLEEAHDTHLISKEGGFCQRIKKEVKEKIVSLVSGGITSTPVVKKVLKHYVTEELDHPDGVQPRQYDRAYFPRNRVITNHIHKALVQGRYAALDLQNLERKTKEWESRDPNVKIFSRKCVETTEGLSTDSQDSEESSEATSKNTFLFVHQTSDQQLLLKRYGGLVLLDATYKTSKYALPLFMLAVPTNVKYLPVAEFVVESESTENIREALEIIKVEPPEKTYVNDRDNLLKLIGAQAEDEEAFFITTREAEQHIESALEKVSRIVSGSIEKENIQIQRHSSFLHRRCSEPVKRGYGFAVFSSPAILYIEQRVKWRFYTDKTSKAYTRHGRIIGMRDETLLSAFIENKYLADIYCSEVLCKETMISIFQSLTGATYEEADMECLLR